MPVYFLVRVKINDPAGYQRYVEEAAKGGIKGRILGYDTAPETVEGDGSFFAGARAVLVEFESEEAFRSWYDSPEYQAAAKHRFDATDSEAILIRPGPIPA